MRFVPGHGREDVRVGTVADPSIGEPTGVIVRVAPFRFSRVYRFMGRGQLYARRETTQVREHNRGASPFGYTKPYGRAPDPRAGYPRAP